MTKQAVLQKQLCEEIRARYPGFTGTNRAPLGHCPDGSGVRILGPMDPCELCGTRVVPLERPAGNRWYSLRTAYFEDSSGRWRVFWDEHSRTRCRRARAGRKATRPDLFGDTR